MINSSLLSDRRFDISSESREFSTLMKNLKAPREVRIAVLIGWKCVGMIHGRPVRTRSPITALKILEDQNCPALTRLTTSRGEEVTLVCDNLGIEIGHEIPVVIKETTVCTWSMPAKLVSRLLGTPDCLVDPHPRILDAHCQRTISIDDELVSNDWLRGDREVDSTLLRVTGCDM